MDRHWAVSIAVADEFLNRLAVSGLGDGLEVATFRQAFSVPMMGEIDLSVDMTITAVEFSMRSEAAGRLHVTVSASGVIEFHGDTPMVALPGAARVRGEVLVTPRVGLRHDGTFVAQLDLPGSELVAVHFDGIDGMTADADAQAMMGQLLFAAVGGELFEGLARQLGPVGLELDADTASVLAEAGVAAGEADVVVEDGVMLVGLPAAGDLGGHARVTGPDGTRIGVAVAGGSLGPLVRRVAAASLGVDLPLDIEIDTTHRRVASRVRNRRLIRSALVPDLRAAVRTTVRPRLVGDRLELSVREAWLELPLVPSVVNDVNRFLGGAASRAPLSLSVPASVTLPVRPGSDATFRLSLGELTVDDHGVSLEVDAEL